MKLRHLFALVLLFFAMATFGCAGMANYQSGTGSASTMMDCNGDLPSHYPPYCHPAHN